MLRLSFLPFTDFEPKELRPEVAARLQFDLCVRVVFQGDCQARQERSTSIPALACWPAARMDVHNVELVELIEHLIACLIPLLLRAVDRQR